MREIKFRGFNKEENKWVYGDLIEDHGKLYIAEKDSIEHINNLEVEKESVGQNTGLKDRWKNEIYEGDIVIHPDIPGLNSKLPVHFEDGAYRIGNKVFTKSDSEEYSRVIGNIFENPEIIEVTKWRRQ